ncbi:MAG: hypothetical protein RL062_173 [Bacteroidota bacterium]
MRKCEFQKACWCILILIFPLWSWSQKVGDEKKKEEKSYAPNFTVWTLRGKRTFDERYHQLKLETSFDSKYSWFAKQDARYFGGKLGLNIRRVNRLGYSYYSFLGPQSYHPIRGFTENVSKTDVMSNYRGWYAERSLVISARTELVLGGAYGKGVAKITAYKIDHPQESSLWQYRYDCAELYLQGTLRATYFMTLTGGVGYRWCVGNLPNVNLPYWVNAPYVNFSVGMSFLKMVGGIFSKNIREVY